MKRLGDSVAVKIGVVVVILIGLIVTGRHGIERQRQKYWRDAVRKDDVARMRQAINDYFQEYGQLPDRDRLRACGSDMLKPYIKAIPCDPVTGEVYPFQKDKQCDVCYELLVKLENVEDEDIQKTGCSQGCGPEGKYNYKAIVRLVREIKGGAAG